MFRLFPIFYDMAEGGPSGGGEGEPNLKEPSSSGGSSSGGSSGGSESSSSTSADVPTYAVNPTLTTQKDTSRIEGEGKKYRKSVPYKGTATQSVLGKHSTTYGTTTPQTLARHIHLHAGPYYQTGYPDTAIRIYVNQYVSAEDCNSQSIIVDNTFDYVESISDVTPPNAGAPYYTGHQTVNMQFFGETVNVGIEQYDTSGSQAVSLVLSSGSEQIIASNNATTQLYIEYENGGSSNQTIPWMPFMRKIKVKWSGGFTKTFDVLLQGEWHSQMGAFNHPNSHNAVRADGCKGDCTANHTLTSVSENYITYNGSQHNGYAYVGFFQEVINNGSYTLPNGYFENTNWNKSRYNDWSFDSNNDPFGFSQSGNQLSDYSGEQYYRGIIGNLNNSSPMGPVTGTINTTVVSQSLPPYQYAINQLHLPVYGPIAPEFDPSTAGQDFSFSNVHVYSFNTPDCTDDPPTVSFDVCLNPNASDYFVYTQDDCNGDDLTNYGGVNYINNQHLATWNQGGLISGAISGTNQCCVDCNDLTLFINLARTTSSTITQGGTEGYITVTVEDSLGNATGNANYNYVLQNMDGQVLGGLGSANSTIVVGSGPQSDTSWTFGYETALVQTAGNSSVPATTNNSASTVLSVTTGSNVNVLVPANTHTGSFTAGLSSGWYKLCVYDDSVTTNTDGSDTIVPCFSCVEFSIADATGVAGCTDNSSGGLGVALNYNSNAVVDDNSCQYCHVSNGTLVDHQNNPIGNNGEIAVSGINSIETTPTLHTDSNDAVITFQNVSPTAAFQIYINNVQNNTYQVNADYTLQLYTTSSMAHYDNALSSSIPNSLTNFSPVGSLVTNAGGVGWAKVFNTATVGSNLNYGYYAIKIAISDPDHDVEIEDCHQVFYFTVPVEACVDSSNTFAIALTSAGAHVTITDDRLWYNNSTICNSVNNFCCNDPILSNPSGPCTVNQIEADFYCDPVPTSMTYTLQYLDPASAAWVNAGPSNTHNPNTSNTHTYTYTQGASASASTFVDNGVYRVVLESTYAAGSAAGASSTCTRTSGSITISMAEYGCMDQNATNYNPTATCPDVCIYCIYGCTNPNATNYDPNATCDDNSCVMPQYGCTDPNASNYNSSATIDDGSCIYGVLGCTDTSAHNYNKDCSGNTVVATIDDGCCFYPCSATSQGAPSTYVIGPATGVCAASNNDGTITVTTSFQTAGVMAGQTKTISYYTNSGTLVYSDPTILSSSTGTTWTYSLLGTGVYYYIIEDNFGCLETVPFSVGNSSVTCGCTDPNATNYDTNATDDDGSCLYNGCIDPNASNYNPNAAADDGSCVYPSAVNPCIPENTNSLISLLEACLAKNGFKYYNKLVTGQADDCSIMDAWKIILIEYLVAKRGNLCIYNCADSGTPAVADINTCGDDWVQGGPVTGVNDQAYAGSSIATGEGTTITDTSLYFVQDNKLFLGDVIKMPSGNIYKVVKKGGCSYGCHNPESAQGMMDGNWEQCVPGLQITSFNDSVNYLDKFNTFVTKFCVDCDIVDENVIKNVRSIKPSRRGRSTGLSIDGISGLEI